MPSNFLEKHKQYKDRIYSFFWFRLGYDQSLAADLSLDVFLDALEKYNSQITARSFRAWLYSLAMKKLLEHFQSIGHSYMIDDYGKKSVLSESDLVEMRKDWQGFLATINKFSASHAEVALLYFFDGLSFSEIAIVMKISEDVVEARLDYVLKEMKGFKDAYSKFAQEFVYPALPSSADRRIKVILFGKVASKEVGNYSHTYLRHRLLVSVFTIILMLLVFYVPKYAYASKEITPGHILYGLKTTVEKLEYTFSEDKSETMIKFSLRRMEEAQVLLERKKDEEEIKGLMQDVLYWNERAYKMVGEDGFSQKTEFRLQGLSIMRDIASEVGIDSDDGLIDDIAVSIEKLKGSSKASSINNDINDVNEELEDTPSNIDNSDGKREESPSIIRSESDEQMTQGVDAIPASVPLGDINKNKEEKKKGQEVILKEEIDEEREAVMEQRDEDVKKEEKKKPDEIRDLKNEVANLEIELKNKNYDKKEVDTLVTKLNNRIEKVEKVKEKSDEKKMEEMITPIKALSNNAEYFIKKDKKVKREDNSKKEEVLEKEEDSKDKREMKPSFETNEEDGSESAEGKASQAGDAMDIDRSAEPGNINSELKRPVEREKPGEGVGGIKDGKTGNEKASEQEQDIDLSDLDIIKEVETASTTNTTEQ